MRVLSRTDNTQLIGLWLLVVPILLFAAVMSARWLSFDIFWIDEWMSLRYAGGPSYGPYAPHELWLRLLGQQISYPPGYPALLAGWTALVGWSEVSGRALSWFGGLLTIAVTYRLTSEAVSRRAGVFAAFCLAVNFLFLYYLHEMRMYTLLPLAATINLWCYWRIAIRKQRSIPLYVTFALSLALMLYLHYLALAIFIALAAYHFLTVWHTRRSGHLSAWWHTFLLMAAGAALFSPWALSLYNVIMDGGGQNTASTSVYSSMEFLAVTPHMFANRGWPLLVVIGIFVLLEARRSIIRLLLFWVVVTLVILALLNIVRPYFISYRYVLMVWPAAAVLVGIGVDRMARQPKYGRIMALLLMLAWLVLSFARANSVEGVSWRGMQAALNMLAEYAQPQDAAIFDWRDRGPFDQRVLNFYTRDLPLPAALSNFQMTGREFDAGEYQRLAADFIADAPYVWLAAVSPPDSQPFVPALETMLAQDYIFCGVVGDHPDMRLLLYRRENTVDERGFACPV